MAPTSAWPPALPHPETVRTSGTPALVVLIAGALLCLGYAAWALTARRGIFADFSAGRTVTSADARSSDTIDTLLLALAGLVALIGLVLWLSRRTAKKTTGGGLDAGGLVLALLSIATVVVGMFLAGTITDAAGRAAQSDKGMTATVVTAAGFVLLAIALLIGSVVIRGRGGPAPPSPSAPVQAQGYQAW